MPIGPALVHVLTALGIVCALFAMLACMAARWETMFLWLGLALIVDGVDGPLARLTHVKERLPRFSGEQLDLVIDYVTYVFIPAIALHTAGFLPGTSGQLLAAAILVSSLYHFSDRDSKADDQSFVGFPAVWNLVAFYLFAFRASPTASALIVLAAVALTFVPLKWVHPLRVTALRPLTIAVSLGAALAAASILLAGFDAPGQTLALTVLAAAAVYALGLTAYAALRLRA